MPRIRPNNDELDERRQTTLRTYLTSNLSMSGMAAAVSAIMTAAHAKDPQPKTYQWDRHDMKRDLDWWRSGNAAKYAPGKKLDAGEAIGAALDFAELCQHEAMQLYTSAAARTGRDREPIHRLDRLLRTAWGIQRDRLNLLFNLGLVDRESAGSALDAQRFGTLNDYQRMIETVRAKRSEIVAPGTEKMLRYLPTDGAEH
jgi:hypothetical protein